MKFLILFACAFAAASASHIVAPLAYHNFYHGAQHLPVIRPNGVPVDTPAVQHAKAAHFTHKIEAHARNGDFVAPVVTYPHTPVVAHHEVAPVVHHEVAPVVHHPVAPVVHHPVAPVVHHEVAPIVHHTPAAYPTTAVHPTSVNGVPLDTPEVAAAKINHFAAHAEALHRHRRGIYTPYAYGAYPYTYGAHAYSAYHPYSYGYPYYY